ncbi:hypothetical protein KJ733_05260 [Patescibacteria group bacterium]|nr:hypothetical protein [Patescibacteria group bacterium]MBU1952289.1 hypothetical protein [Patescibacteria group bacterium]
MTNREMPQNDPETNNNKAEVLETVQRLKEYVANNDIVLDHTFADGSALGELETFLNEVETNPDKWTSNKVNDEFKNLTNRLAEPPLF